MQENTDPAILRLINHRRNHLYPNINVFTVFSFCAPLHISFGGIIVMWPQKIIVTLNSNPPPPT
jgi:hypothetical protein